ncbi:MAG: D-glycerate dehydrogenase, partial [Gammaproteobacteria bacterium]|nr:D-glycerate dehydrogenase [Gammaproteobacteria bacterium]
VVTRKWPKECEDVIVETFDAELNEHDRPLSVAELQRALRSADALFTTVTDSIGKEVLKVRSMQARLLANFGAGYNNIDAEAAKDRGLIITNTPDVLTDCTADITMALILMVSRRAAEGDRHVRNREWVGWRPTHMMGRKVTGKTLGILGFGRIGQAVAKRAHLGFGMKVLVYNRSKLNQDTLKAVGAKQMESIDSVLKQSDYVSVHCPATPDTHHLINAKRLKLMKSDAYLINTARGPIVDEHALVEALYSHALAGAGLDVYEHEPEVSEALLSLANVVLLPHLGSATRETRIAMGMKVIENAKAFFNGEKPPNRVA